MPSLEINRPRSFWRLSTELVVLETFSVTNPPARSFKPA
jgi:hypothetical protein